jgi:hypothetical protein
MRNIRKTNFFTTKKTDDFLIQNITTELNTSESDIDIDDKQVSDGQNVISGSFSSTKKRGGITLHGNFIGENGGINGGWSFVGSNGTQEELVVYDTNLYRKVGSDWVAITGVTMTTGLPCSGVYFPFTDKFYIINGTDNVVKYIAGSTSGDQTDASFPKGTLIEQFQNRLLVANTTSHPDYVYYSDTQADTFTLGTNWYQLVGEATDLINFNNVMILNFTKRKVYRLMNFYFDGTTSWASQLYEIPTPFGTIAANSPAVVNNLVYFVGQDMNNVASIYQTDGYSAVSISYDRIFNTMQGLSSSQLEHAVGIADSYYYRLYVTELGKTVNNIGIIYDSVKKIFYPVERRFVEGISNFSSLWSSENSGIWNVFGGTNDTGQIYKLNANDGFYDELSEERFITLGATANEIELISNKKAAQSFKYSNYNNTLSVYITKAVLNIKTNGGGTPEDLVVRIETDVAGKPSGTSIGSTIISSTSITSNYSWVTASFSSAIKLTGNTTYWMVIQSVAGTNDSKYLWRKNASGGYVNGSSASYASSAWTVETGSDLNFVLYSESAIDGYFDTKAFMANKGRELVIRKHETVWSSLGTFSMEVGFSESGNNTFSSTLVDLTTDGISKWGDGISKWGDGTSVWGGASSRKYIWTPIEGFYSRVIKMRVRNRNANQQFEFNMANVIVTGRERDI